MMYNVLGNNLFTDAQEEYIIFIKKLCHISVWNIIFL